MVLQNLQLRYACRDFIKGRGEDEERLMRRIMITRRNNVKEHKLLKKARKRQHEQQWATQSALRMQGSSQTPASLSTSGALASSVSVNHPLSASSLAHSSDDNGALLGSASAAHTSSATASAQTMTADRSQEKCSSSFITGVGVGPSKVQHSEHASSPSMDVFGLPKDMDYEAVIATRSFRRWRTLRNGAEFTYNQRFIKGKEGHEELLLKNIWRRMKYRRDNKDLVDQYTKDASRRRMRLNEAKVGDVAGVNDEVLNDDRSATTYDGGIHTIAASTNALLTHEDLQNMENAIHNTAGIAAALAANSSLLEAETSVVNVETAVPHGIKALPHPMDQFANASTPNQRKIKGESDDSFISNV